MPSSKENTQQTLHNSIYQSIFENGNTAMLLGHVQGNLLEVNEAACQLFGYTRLELLKIGFGGILQTDQKLESIFKDTVALGRANGIINCKRKDQEIFRASISTVLIKDNAGKEFLNISLLDLGKELHLETVMNESAQLAMFDRISLDLETKSRWINSTINASPDIVSVLDIFGNRKIINRSAKEKFGYSLTELKNTPIFEFIHEEDKLAAEVLFQQMPTLKSVTNFQNRIIGKDGSIINMAWSFTWDDQTEVIYALGRDISEQKKMEAALKEQQAYLYAYIEQSADALFVHDFSGRFIEVNRMACESLGYTREELLQMTVADIEVDSDLNAIQSVWKSVVPYKPIMIMGHQRRKNGEVFPVEIQFSRFNFNGKDILYGLVRDITARKKEVETILKNEMQFRALIANLQVGVLKQGPDAKILLSNKKALELLGISEDQLLGKTSFDPDWNVIHEDGSPYPGPTHPVPMVIATKKQVLDAVMGVYRPDTKDRVWLLVNAEPVFDENQELDYIICTFNDITEKKRIEAEQLANLKRYQLLMQTSKDPIYILNKHGKLLEWNDAFIHHLGYDTDEYKDLYVWDWNKDENLTKESVERFFESIDENGISFEADHVLKNGSICNMDIRLHKFLFGHVELFYASARDITSKKITDKKIMDLNEELRALSGYMQELIETEKTAIAKQIHDEFAQNFVALLMNINWLKTKIRANLPEQHKLLDEQLRIVNEVIASSRKLFNTLHPSMLDELGLIATIKWFSKTYFKSADVVFVLNTNIENEPLTKEINLTLYRVFQEAINNILQFAKASKVVVDIYKYHKAITLSITDNGIGFNYHSINTREQHGLLVMRERVYARKGKISIDAAPGKGTTIQVELPFDSATQEQA
jgi:PAS domain S-box-containing protein